MQKHKIGIAVTVLAAAMVLFGVVFWLNRPVGAQGEKTIAVQIVAADQSDKTYTITTQEKFLRGALEQESLIAGEESQYGLFVKTVDGVTADDSLQQWWCFTKDGVSLETGVDTTPIADGDHFEITLTTGY